MKLFFSINFFFFIALLNVLLFKKTGWLLLALAFFLILLFARKYFKEITLKKLFLLFFVFLLISLNLVIKNYQIQQINLTPRAEKDVYQINEKFTNSLILTNSKNQKIYLSSYFLTLLERKNIRLHIGDKFIAKIFLTKREMIDKNNFELFLKSKNIIFNGKLINNFISKIYYNESIYNKLIRYFQSKSNSQIKDWVLFLIFQSSEKKMTQTKDHLKNLGVAHLFVVSGFHLIIVGAFWFWISKKQKRKIFKIIFQLIGLFFCVFLTYLTNWKLSSTKALILIFLAFFSNLFKKKINFDKVEIISILGMFFLCVNPWFFYQLSFQLSFLASWILAFFSQSTIFKKNKIVGFCLKNWLIWIILFPIIINLNFRFNFFTPLLISVYSLVISIFYPIFIVLIWIPIFSKYFAYFFQILEKSILFFDQLKWTIPFGSMSKIMILIYYFVFISIGKIYLKIDEINWFLLFGVILIFGNFFGNLHKHPYYHFHMIDVGNGLSMFLQSPNKKTNILFDAGSGIFKKNDTKIISNFLKKNNVRKIDAIFISHHHRDHYNNLEHLQQNFLIKKIFRNQNQKKNYQINEFNFENLAVSFYKEMNNENNRGIVLQFILKNQNFLLAFDMEKELEKKIIENSDPQKIDILQVGHHGSKTSSSEAFLNFYQPKYCLISANKKTPQEEILEKANCEVYNTNKVGTINLYLKKELLLTTKK